MQELVSRLAAASYRQAMPLLVAALLLVLASPLFLVGLELDSDTSRLIRAADPVGTAYRQGKIHHGEANPLVVQLAFSDVELSTVDLLTDRLAASLEDEPDISSVDAGGSGLLEHPEAARRLRAGLLNSRPPLIEELARRLDERGMRRALRRSRKRMVVVDDPELRRSIAADVLGIGALVAPYYQKRSALLGALSERGYFDAPDGGSRLLFVQPEGSSEDSAYCVDLLKRIERLFDTLRSELLGGVRAAEAIEMRFTGVHAITAESASALAQDMKWITAVATVALFLLLWLSFRRMRVTLLCFLPLLVSLAAALLLARALFNPINYLTIGFAAIVIGLGLDVSLHLTSRLFHFLKDRGRAEAVRLTLRDSGPPVIIGTTTTAAAFLALFWADNPGLSRFGLLTAGGLLLSLVITLVLFPALARYLAPAKRATTTGLVVWWIPSWLLRIGASHPAPAIAAALVLVVVGLTSARHFELDMEIDQLMPQELGAVELAREITLNHGVSMSPLLQVVVEADSSAAALDVQQRLDQLLEELVREGAVAGFHSPSELLVYPEALERTQELRARTASALSLERASFFELLDELRFRPNPLFDRYYATLEEATRINNDQDTHWPTDLKHLAVEDGEIYRLRTTVWPLDGDQERASSRNLSRRLQDLPVPPGTALQVTGIALVYKRMNELLTDAFFDVSWIAAISAAGIVLLFFRTPAGAVLSLVPLGAALPVTLGAVALSGQSLPPTAIAFGAVIVGIGIDDAVHLVARTRSREGPSILETMDEIGPIITLTTVSTVIGFGSLSLSSLPVVASLGRVVAIGVVACWLFAVLLLPALMTLASRARTTPRS